MEDGWGGTLGTFNMQHSKPNVEGKRRELREFSRMESGGGPPQSKTLARMVGRVTPSRLTRIRRLASAQRAEDCAPYLCEASWCASPLAF